ARGSPTARRGNPARSRRALRRARHLLGQQGRSAPQDRGADGGREPRGSLIARAATHGRVSLSAAATGCATLLCGPMEAAYFPPQVGKCEGDIRSGTVATSRQQETSAMKPRLNLVGLLAVGLTGLTWAGMDDAAALDYPTRPVRWVVGYPAGGST